MLVSVHNVANVNTIILVSNTCFFSFKSRGVFTYEEVFQYNRFSMEAVSGLRKLCSVISEGIHLSEGITGSIIYNKLFQFILFEFFSLTFDSKLKAFFQRKRTNSLH